MSREEAIKVLSDLHDQCCEASNIFCTLDSDARCEAVEMAIKALEREPCGNCVNKNILKAQMEYYGFHAPDMTITEFAEDLFSSCKSEPCEDAVSRVDVLECFSDLYDTFEDCSKGIVNELHRKFDDLRTLPSVTPERKKGKWTKDCACEICGFKPWYERDIHTLSFCPSCGTDMREDQDDQNK